MTKRSKSHKQKTKSKVMNNKFDELAKSMAQSVTRRQAFKKSGLGLAGMALACFGLANKAEAAKGGCRPSYALCKHNNQCCSGTCFFEFGVGGCL
jgi:hypothetical protein